jgi:hypothetical protein
MNRFVLVVLLALVACSKSDPCPALRADLRAKQEAARTCLKDAARIATRAEDGIPPPSAVPDCDATSAAATAAAKAFQSASCK